VLEDLILKAIIFSNFFSHLPLIIVQSRRKILLHAIQRLQILGTSPVEWHGWCPELYSLW